MDHCVACGTHRNEIADRVHLVAGLPLGHLDEVVYMYQALASLTEDIAAVEAAHHTGGPVVGEAFRACLRIAFISIHSDADRASLDQWGILFGVHGRSRVRPQHDETLRIISGQLHPGAHQVVPRCPGYVGLQHLDGQSILDGHLPVPFDVYIVRNIATTRPIVVPVHILVCLRHGRARRDDAAIRMHAHEEDSVPVLDSTGPTPNGPWLRVQLAGGDILDPDQPFVIRYDPLGGISGKEEDGHIETLGVHRSRILRLAADPYTDTHTRRFGPSAWVSSSG